MVGKVNYSGGTASEATFSLKVAHPKGVSNNTFVISLVNAASKYVDGSAEYAIPSVVPIPFVGDGKMDANEYNSNSYVSGVFLKAGYIVPLKEIIEKQDFQTPGLENPLPIDFLRDHPQQ